MSSQTISRSSATFIFLCLWGLISNVQADDFFVKKFGARGDGKSDDTQAIEKAWHAACKSTKASRVVIPKGKYVVDSIKLLGPCNAPIHLQMDGTMEAPLHTHMMKIDHSWVVFQYINGFTLSGSGVFDGKGAHTWNKSDCPSKGKCTAIPISLRFHNLNNSIIEGITSTDSKFFHINVINSRNVTLQKITIDAPDESPNTDGIHIGRSSAIYIRDSVIKTGDDCVSIGDGSQQVHIEKVTCGPGHGISIGSLGMYKNEQPVSGIFVKDCTFLNTEYGVRVKAWPDSTKAIATNLQFDGIVMNNVTTPILIDQQYCPYGNCNQKVGSRVEISNVGFKNIRGTSRSQVAMKLACSRAYPCKNVKLSNINLKYTGKNGTAISECSNVKPTISGNVVPPACTKALTNLIYA